jgi:hypothetical protein
LLTELGHRLFVLHLFCWILCCNVCAWRTS